MLYHRMIDIDIVLVTSSIVLWFFLTASLDRLSSEEFGCKCQDAPNNTYACVRTLGKEDTMFCQFPDQQEMYSLAQDPHQLTNIANLLTTDTIEYYEVTSDRRNNPPSIFLVLDFCEAQGNGRAKGRPRKVSQRSFIDGGWWMVDILSLMLYIKFG